MHYNDIEGLTPEPHSSNISDERLRLAGLGEAAIEFLSDQRVELNAMTSRGLIDFLEAKLQQHGIGKVVPDRETLASTYQMFAASDYLAKAFDELKEEIENDDEARIQVPDDLETQVKAKLEEKPEITWHRAVRLIIDPDAPEKENDEEDDDALDEGDDFIEE